MAGVTAPRQVRDPGRRTVAAFTLLVVLVGINLVAIRYSNRELDPLWNAGIRFVLAAVVFAGLAIARRASWPGMDVAIGAAAYGILAFVLFFAFLYAGLERASVGLGQTILALGPLLTLAMAVAIGLERFRWRAVVGAVVAVAGIGIALGAEAGAGLPVPSLLSVLAAAISFAAAGILAKRLPPADPVVQNAIGTAVAAVLLLALSVLTGERWAVPLDPGTWLAIAYLALPGTVVIFLLFLHVVRRWEASRVSYQFVLAPIVAIVVAAVVLGEPITRAMVAGTALVILGVWIGALSGEGT